MKIIAFLLALISTSASADIIAYKINNYLYAVNDRGIMIVNGVFNPSQVQVSNKIISYVFNTYLYAANEDGVFIINGVPNPNGVIVSEK